MAIVVKPAKAKAAERVIEVLDYFDEQHRQATVMDIARRYNRPQSSTSELLASLVDLGLLYKDAISRSYTLTPRAAILGSLSQPAMIRDGRMAQLFDALRAETGLGVALFGMVGTNVQLFRWRAGLQRIDSGGAVALAAGTQDSLVRSAAGQLLLSTLTIQRREGLLRRLNAEAAADRKFVPAEIGLAVQGFTKLGYATGMVGFDVAARVTAVLVPAEPDSRPTAIGLVHDGEADAATLAATLDRLVRRYASASFEGTTTPIAA